MNKIMEITNETTRVRATPFRTKTRAFCPTCQKPVDLMSLLQTAEFYKSNLQDIKTLTANIILHPIHNNRGELMICSESLFTFFDQRQTKLLDEEYVSAASLKICQ